MNGKATIFLGLMLALAAMPAADANHPNTVCNPTEARHSYTVTLGAYAHVQAGPVDEDAGVAATVVVDTCGTVEGDAEAELGVAGGRFSAGTSVCVTNAHHAYGQGAAYWADDETGVATLSYSVGADGPALVPDPLDPCATDGVISNDPTTDPLDCGDGAMGAYAPPTWTPATLGETVPGNGACNPYDGNVWMFLSAGPVVDGETVVVSTPLSGHAWS